MSDRRQVGVMLIPSPLPCLPETAHLTVVYAGDGVHEFTVSQLCRLSKMMAGRTDPFAAMTLGMNYNFGDEVDEPVILLGLTPELAAMRSVFASYSRSSHTEFRPHVAAPDIRSYFSHGWKLPRHLYFSRIAVWVDNAPACDLFLGTGTPA